MEGAVTSITGNEGRITQAWVNVRGGMKFLQHASGTRRDGPQDMKLSWIRAKSLVSKRSDACDSTRGSVNVQVENCQGRLG